MNSNRKNPIDDSYSLDYDWKFVASRNLKCSNTEGGNKPWNDSAWKRELEVLEAMLLKRKLDLAEFNKSRRDNAPQLFRKATDDITEIKNAINKLVIKV